MGGPAVFPPQRAPLGAAAAVEPLRAATADAGAGKR